jgi:hypothetical protein
VTGFHAYRSQDNTNGAGSTSLFPDDLAEICSAHPYPKASETFSFLALYLYCLRLFNQGMNDLQGEKPYVIGLIALHRAYRLCCHNATSFSIRVASMRRIVSSPLLCTLFSCS